MRLNKSIYGKNHCFPTLIFVCLGTTHTCPDNQYLGDGGPCNNDTSYCFEGQCKTHDDACVFLWGDNAKMSDPDCYNPNAEEASTWAGCGKISL